MLLFELFFGFKLVIWGPSLNFLGPKFKTKLYTYYVLLFLIGPSIALSLHTDNSLNVQYYLSFGRHYNIYFVFISIFTRKYESLQVSLKYTPYVYFSFVGD